MNKRLVCGLLFLFPAVLIVRPVIRSVNISAHHAILGASTAADGDPMPDPRGPHKPGAGLLATDGDPMPSPSGPHATMVA
jgi:hypothetical protein